MACAGCGVPTAGADITAGAEIHPDVELRTTAVEETPLIPDAS
eukprot:gene17436-25042_t